MVPYVDSWLNIYTLVAFHALRIKIDARLANFATVMSVGGGPIYASSMTLHQNPLLPIGIPREWTTLSTSANHVIATSSNATSVPSAACRLRKISLTEISSRRSVVNVTLNGTAVDEIASR
eukprot:jgi/Phyca11/21660/fgenesh1_pg.PHYCAscaffold_105_\